MSVLPIDNPVAARENEMPNLQALNNYLSTSNPSLGTIQEIKQFPGGYSNLTFCLRTSTSEYILRRPPVGANIKSAHDMGREFNVLSKVKVHYPNVPTPLLYCDNSEIIGAPFYIMERLQGVILRASQAQHHSISSDEFKRLSESLVENLVTIHCIDIHTTNLIELGKPEGYIQRQVEGWTKRYFNAETDTIPEMNALSEWLIQNIPAEQSAALLHNDYKYDNLVLDPYDISKIIGVLDWEMATVGDPLMDVGASLAYWSERNDDKILQSFNVTALPGNITRKEFATLYALKSGRDITNILFYYAFGLFKNAVIAQQIYARWKKGLTTDARFGGLIYVINALSRQGSLALEKQSI